MNAISICGQAIEFDSPVLHEEGFDPMGQDVNVLALVKGEERYIFLYNDSHKSETLRTLGRYASNPELSFTWYDAAVLSQKIRQESQQKTRERQQQNLVTNRCGTVPLSSEELY